MRKSEPSLIGHLRQACSCGRITLQIDNEVIIKVCCVRTNTNLCVIYNLQLIVTLNWFVPIMDGTGMINKWIRIGNHIKIA